MAKQSPEHFLNLIIFTKIISLLYYFLKILARLALPIFCRKIIINNRDLLKQEGPLLLACNHPNSFLDSIILDTLMQQPVWSLARGDVFKKRFYSKLLAAIKILPVYRTSEGVENLSENYKTFSKCIELFKKNRVVTIFSEGKCINEWHLRPLKKGTARLALQAWDENIPLKVLPVGINYNSFRLFGKNVFINFGQMIGKEDIDLNTADGMRHLAFNNRLKKELEQLVYEIERDDQQQKIKFLTVNVSLLKKIILAIPSIIGYILHLPLYIPVKRFASGKTAGTDHYDSVITAILFLTYPLLLLVLCILLWIITGYWQVFLLLIVLPFTAWSHVQLKKQLD